LSFCPKSNIRESENVSKEKFEKLRMGEVEEMRRRN
jgi:hypothetical protein